MAHSMTGHTAFASTMGGKPLRGFKGGIVVTCKERVEVKDAHGTSIVLDRGDVYRITGTRDGDGYAIATHAGCFYLTAEVGCHLVVV